MRKPLKIPRIIKINQISGFQVFCAFNNGEHRIIDFKQLFEKWNYQSDDFRSKLLDQEEFSKVRVNEGTLQWPNLTQKLKLSNGLEFDAMFDLDPVVLYEESIADEERNKMYQIGDMIKNARIEAGLTQTELAKRSGTTKNYISRIENNRSDLEVGTLIKIIEIGLGKKLKIGIG